jgi:hypothetical protein
MQNSRGEWGEAGKHCLPSPRFIFSVFFSGFYVSASLPNNPSVEFCYAKLLSPMRGIGPGALRTRGVAPLLEFCYAKLLSPMRSIGPGALPPAEGGSGTACRWSEGGNFPPPCKHWLPSPRFANIVFLSPLTTISRLTRGSPTEKGRAYRGRC